MTLLLDSAGLSDLAFANLFTISGDDGGLGSTDGPDPGVLLVTYVLTPGQPATATRLDELANTDFGRPIVITALNGGTDPYSELDVTGNGFTYSDTSGGSPVIRVVYDVSQCCGSGIAALDTNGDQIASPNPVILYHELSHAFRRATNTQEDDDEVPASTDENVMRGVLGLCMRDVNNHDGACAGGSTCGGSDGGIGGPPAAECGTSDNGGCFIVSAATRSPESSEIARLRELRDRVASTSGLAAQLIEAIYRDYWQFSPAIASSVRQSVLVRAAALGIVVRPLLAWYTLAATLALRPGDGDAALDAERELRNACRSFFGRTRVLRVLEAIQGGKTLPVDARERVRDLGPQILRAARFPRASWAILDPLVHAWRSAPDHSTLYEDVARWLATAPLGGLTLPDAPDRREQEVRVLSSFFNFHPPARAQLGARLVHRWPGDAELLARHGFIEVHRCQKNER